MAFSYPFQSIFFAYFGEFKIVPRLIRSTLQGTASIWSPQNNLCAVIAPLHRRVHFDIAISCILLGIPVVLVDVHKLDK
ncbi:hypothetical protein TELCIR_06989 [Teladorsagia circumcincta]|uniref:Uncharacterized protein n=1 Tax=Teladorsagia circumcincta TaxID=45464 RepID=A0A2G9ULI8_TELCI|nr:hypothetical protein TELCIR_06989 [Teladorsagia circumcincta]